MLQSKQFVKKTRKGSLLKVVREHYLRDDIVCGAAACGSCQQESPVLSAAAPQILVVDTNIVLHQIDFLENATVTNVVVLSVVLEEAKHKNLSVYNRLRAIIANPARHFFVFANEHHRETFIKSEPGESPNDRNDRAIRIACQWYQRHLGDSVKVLLLTNDAENMRKAVSAGQLAQTVYAYVEKLGDAELVDIIQKSATGEDADGDASMDQHEDAQTSKKTVLYAEHKPMSEITEGLRRGVFHQGRLRVHPYNSQEAYVGSESVGDEILICGRFDLNRAVDGDVVAVELLPEESWRETGRQKLADVDEADDEPDEVGLAPAVADDPPTSNVSATTGRSSFARPTGKVVGIIKRNWRLYCGSLEAMKNAGASVASALFVSADRRIPKVRIRTRQLANLADKRIVVAIDTWDRNARYPSGHYVKTLGIIGDKATESEVLLMENDINVRPFSEQVLACLPPLPWSVSEADFQNPTRQDLRHLHIFSVDPIGCKDIDDALHCNLLESGNYEVGVHIADVTNFVFPASPLDEEASERGTSVYLVDRRIDMLPKPLTEDICSLRADVERLAFSVLWEMTPQADTISTRFTKSVIKSAAALSYVEAQARMDDVRLSDPLTIDLRNMNNLAKVMRQRRLDRGALTLASPEVKFEIDTETHDPLDVGMYQVREANQMVEEFMLAANISVATKILSFCPATSLLRRHPVPKPKMFEPLLQTAAAVGIDISTATSRELADSLDKAQGPGSDPYFNKLIRILATRCMTQAVYFASGELSPPDYFHYGLAAPIYTHFTSPIRRYADVLVHRTLAAALGLSPLPHLILDKKALNASADNLNYRHRNAQMAGRASVELHTLIFFRKRPTDADARIVKIRANGFIVFVPKYGIEGPVYLVPRDNERKRHTTTAIPALEGDWVVDEAAQTLSLSGNAQCFKVLDQVQVHIAVVEPQPNRPKLALTLLPPLGAT
eukprot:SM000116S24234  [mRNA]  locus=s116:202438:210497:+ [translate_table: standard]